MTLFIQNVGAGDIPSGNHFDCGENSMLIQISDPFAAQSELQFGCTPWFPVPKHKFKEVYQFQFLDIWEDDVRAAQYGITDEQAAHLVLLLQHALQERMQVVVHCFAGVCRSGAVAEIGIQMGFTDTKKFRLANPWVKQKMSAVLDKLT